MLPAYRLVWYRDVTVRKWDFLTWSPSQTSYSTTVRKAATTVVRPRSDQRLRYIYR